MKFLFHGSESENDASILNALNEIISYPASILLIQICGLDGSHTQLIYYLQKLLQLYRSCSVTSHRHMKS